MAVNHNVANVNIDDTIQRTGAAFQVAGRPFSLLVKNDHDAAITLTVQVCHDGEFAEIWEIDQWAIPVETIGVSRYYFEAGYTAPFEYVRVAYQAVTIPTGGTLDVWIPYGS